MALTAGNLKAGVCVRASVSVGIFCQLFRLTALTSSHYLADEIEYHLHCETGNETTTTGTAPFHAAVNGEILVEI